MTERTKQLIAEVLDDDPGFTGTEIVETIREALEALDADDGVAIQMATILKLVEIGANAVRNDRLTTKAFEKKQDDLGVHVCGFMSAGNFLGYEFAVFAPSIDELEEAWQFTFGLDCKFDRGSADA